MKTVANIWLCLITAAFVTLVKAQSPVTNASIGGFNFHLAVPPVTNTPVQPKPSFDPDKPVPLVRFGDVPLSTVIENLALGAGINYLIDPEVAHDWATVDEPTVTFRMKTVDCNEALQRVLSVYHLSLVKDPLSNIAILTTAAEDARGTFAGASGTEANSYLQHTNLLPVIRFTEVPLTTAIKNLALQENLNYTLDPALADAWIGEGKREPVLNLRLETVTAWATLNRILQSYRLQLIVSPVSHVAHVTSMDTPPQKIDVSALHMETETNIPIQTNDASIPVIRFTDVPLETALENLIIASDTKIELDPRITSKAPLNERWFQPMPMLSLRWEYVMPKHAIVALCENYNLRIATNENGTILIKPPETMSQRH